MEDNRSLAVRAHSWQDLDTPTAENPLYIPENTAFPGHDTFQNGVIPENQPTTFYTAATDRNIENIKNHNSDFSGFFTDADTVNASCKNGVLDANDFAKKTQTKPWRPSEAPSGTEYTYRSNVAAFDVNWGELNKPENKDLKDKLCNPDGLSPESGDIKTAYGKAEANTQWGRGGGNQYYIDKDTFNDAVNRGVFQYNEDKSFMESKGNLERSGVSEKDMARMDDLRQENINESLRSCADKSAISSVDKAKSLNEITPEKEKNINAAEVPKGNYIASPDPAYNYGQSEDVSKNNRSSSRTESTDKVTDGGGARAPNDSSNNRQRGENPPQDSNSQKNNTTNKVMGEEPEQTANKDQKKGPNGMGETPNSADQSQPKKVDGNEGTLKSSVDDAVTEQAQKAAEKAAEEAAKAAERAAQKAEKGARNAAGIPI